MADGSGDILPGVRGGSARKVSYGADGTGWRRLVFHIEMLRGGSLRLAFRKVENIGLGSGLGV